MAAKKRNPLTTAGTVLPLAIGLAMNGMGPSKPATMTARSGGSRACVASLTQCPVTGCANANDPDEQLLNRTKEHTPTAATPKLLVLTDFTTLQNQADSTVGQGQPLDASSRAELQNLQVSSGQTVSEGDLVQVDGFLVGKPHPNTGESVNCNLTGSANNDFHIPFADDPDKSPFEGIVVEMIPQSRPATWSVKNLTKAETARRMVRVTGQLFYDNAHKVNPDQDEPLGGQPPRFSLWEVHPIVTFSVCKTSDAPCGPNDWEPLDAFAGEPTAAK
jgi:hypothetical protein